MKNNTIGNQQGNISYNIGYLIGILDGEGTISLSRCVSPKKGHFKMSPLITITNTDEKIVNKTIEALETINIPYYISSSQKTKSKRIIYRIIIGGLKRVDRLVSVLIDYDFGKSERLKLLKEFIDSRKKVIDKHSFKKPYTLREVEIFNDIRILNGQGGKSSRLIDPQRLPSGMFIKT